MKMYFHFGYAEYILFSGLVPQSPQQFICSCAVLFILSSSHQFLKHTLEIRQGAWLKKIQKGKRSDIKEELMCATLKFIEIILGLCLMLLLMTFNVGIIFSILLGGCTWHIIFQPFVSEEKKSKKNKLRMSGINELATSRRESPTGPPSPLLSVYTERLGKLPSRTSTADRIEL
ncbi:endosomal membrane protein [Planoprotostelium fungivorum]|uniref:Copper transport protein n=1 Tax=Planoprotostelium fungivorum TaxID=1890364 RepID=A0A2P6NLM4_9EUKA|nr:endosomal membrane protein [Planoprotostelium fungivorum]